MNFFTVATAAAIVSVLIGAIWIFAGRFMFKRWGIEAVPQGLMMGRRLGAVYLGVALLLWLVRDSQAAVTQNAVSAGLCLALTLLTAFSFIEVIARRAGRAMLVSVLVEVLLALGFAHVIFS